MNEDATASQIRSIQTLGSVAIIASPVSLVFGGILLSLVALICALVGRSKLKTLQEAVKLDESVVQTLRRQNTVGLVISAVAVCINAVTFAMVFGMLMQAMQSGDYSQLSQLLGMDASMLTGGETQDAGTVPEQTGSVWD